MRLKVGMMREQSSQTEQVSSAVEEMSSTIQDVAGKGADAAGVAQSAGSRAQHGGQTVSRTAEGINQLAEVVRGATDAVGDLGHRAEQIGQIIDVINDIADQTNLLALNAAIEAARAGEHGRGFAVVADEVRKLAERTTGATAEVAESITAIQERTKDAVERMKSGNERAEQGVTLAGEAGDSLREIVAGAEQVVGAINSIAAATEEQASASEQISRSVEGIRSVARQSAEGVEQAASAASELSNKAEHLAEMIARFRLGTDRRRGRAEPGRARHQPDVGRTTRSNSPGPASAAAADASLAAQSTYIASPFCPFALLYEKPVGCSVSGFVGSSSSHRGVRSDSSSGYSPCSSRCASSAAAIGRLSRSAACSAAIETRNTSSSPTRFAACQKRPGTGLRPARASSSPSRQRREGVRARGSSSRLVIRSSAA